MTFVIFFSVILAAAYSQQPGSTQRSKKLLTFADQMSRSSIPYIPPGKLKSPSDLGNPPSVNRVCRFGGDAADMARSIATDVNGNSYVTGYFSGPVSFGIIPLSSIGRTDAFVAKYNSSGLLLWIRQISCDAYEIAKGTGIAIDHLNNVFVTGYYNGATLHVGNSSVIRTGYEDIFIAKFDENGTVLMISHHGVASQVRQALQITADNEGNSYIIYGGEYSASQGGTNVLKFDLYGNLMSDYSNGARFMDVTVRNPVISSPGPMPSCITIDPPGATVYDSITLTFNPSLACFNNGSLVGAPHIYMHSGVTIGGADWQYMVNYNSVGANGQSTLLTSNGNGTYSIRFRPSEFYGLPPGTIVTRLCMVFNDGQWNSKDGRDFNIITSSCMDIFVPIHYMPSPPSIYLTGHITSPVNFGSITLNASSYQNAPFLAKCDPSLNFSWAVQGVTAASGSAYNRSFSVSTDDNENVYFSGRFRRTLTFGTQSISNTSSIYTPFLVKCNSGGTFEWVRKGDVAYGIKSTSASNPVVVGVDGAGSPYISFDLLGDIFVFGAYTITGNGGGLVRYAPDGAAMWALNKDCSPTGLSGTNDEKILSSGSLNGNIVVSQTNNAGLEEWRAATTGNNGTAQVVNLKTDHAGNLICYGKTDIPDPMFGNMSGTFISKMKPGGEVIWTLPFTGGYYSEGYGDYLTVDQEDNIIVLGQFSDTLSIGSSTLINTGMVAGIFIVKTDLDGNVQWLKQIGDAQFLNDVNSVTADFANNIIVSGTFRETMVIETSILLSAGDNDVFVAKYGAAGNFQWAKRAGGETIEYNGYLSSDSLNNIYLTGEFTSREITIDTYPLPLTESDGDVVLAKFTPSGTVMWGFAYGADPTPGSYGRYNCWPNAIKTNSSGDSYIYGWTGDHNYFGPFLLESLGGWSFFLIKVDNSGIVQWATDIKEKGQNWHSMQIDIDKAGNCYAGGVMYDSTWFGNMPVIGQGKFDLFIAKYNHLGDFKWVKTFGSNPLNRFQEYSRQNLLYGIAAYDSSSIFVGGSFSNDLQFDTAVIHSSGVNGFISLLGADIPAVPAQRILTNITVCNEMTRCYNATDIIRVAGNGTTFSVNDGGSVTMISGHKIQYFPGTTVHYGGYLNGRISPSGPFCQTPSMPEVVEAEKVSSPMVSEKSWIKIYPNPTSGNFHLVISSQSGIATFEIYSMQAKQILSGAIPGSGEYDLSLEGVPPGIYLVRVITGSRVEAVRIIKQ